MKVYLIGYDLTRPYSEYESLTTRLKSYGAWWHHLDSTWLIATDLTIVQVRDELSSHLHSGDELLVIDVTGARWANRGFASRASEWLHKHLP